MTLLACIYGNQMQIAQFLIQTNWIWDFLQSLWTKNKSDWKYIYLFMSSNIHEKISPIVCLNCKKKKSKIPLVEWLKKKESEPNIIKP